MATKRGFTLIELLVVILIIGVLAGLIVTAVGSVRQRTFVAKAKTNINSLAVALAAYHTLTGVYPGAGSALPKDDPVALFAALYTGNPKCGGSRENHLQDWPVEQIGRFDGFQEDPDAVYPQARDEDLIFDNRQGLPNLVFLDAWNRPYHYVEWESRPASQRQLPGGQLRAKGAAPFAIWSDGQNRRNEWGKGDDVTSWTEQGSGGGR